MSLYSAKYRGVQLLNTAIPQVFDECYVFTIAVLKMFCTYVDRQEEPDVKNTQIFEYEELITKLTELCKESMFHNLLDRTLDKFEDYKAELLDKASMVNFLPYAVHTDLDQDEDVKEDSHSASVNANIPI